MFEVSPLSPVREWAIARSRISALHVSDGGLGQALREEHRADGDHLLGRLRRTAAAGRAVEVERLHLVADAHRVRQAVGPTDDPGPHLRRLVPGFGQLASEDRVDADEVATDL